VTTVQSLRNQGEGDLDRGAPNLVRHIQNLKQFGVPTVVAINRFPSDTEADLNRLAEYCAQQGAVSALSEAFTKGGEGAAAMALVGKVIGTHAVPLGGPVVISDGRAQSVQSTEFCAPMAGSAATLSARRSLSGT